MELSPNMNLPQKQLQQQKLALTEQMRESLKLLQISLPELKEYVDRELLENPMLEYGETTSEGNGLFYGYSRGWSGLTSTDSRQDVYDPFYSASAKFTFSAFLLGQLLEMEISPALEKICRYLIESLDKQGYLRESAEKAAADLKTDLPSVLKAIGLVQRLEPAGVGASSLSECLSLQIQRLPDRCPAMQDIVEHHLELLSKNKIKAIADKTNLSLRQAQKCCDRIRRLNPIPSSGYNTETTEIFVVPEAEIVHGPDGSFEIVSNKEYIPRLQINRMYLQLLKTPDSQETAQYVSLKYKKARFLIATIQNREKTITRILKKILELQPLYFEKGAGYLRAMSLKEIAEGLNLSESTVCRAVQDKYFLYGSGVIRIKSLFSGGPNKKGGNEISSFGVKEKISGLLSQEDKNRPLSDQAIASVLQKEHGIGISRRTVAKYRFMLGFPPASGRKSFHYTR